MNVVSIFENYDRRESDRLQALHVDRLELDELSADLGSADEWLFSAMGHLKVAGCDDPSAKTVTVSRAALSLLLWKVEELVYDGTAWFPGIDLE